MDDFYSINVNQIQKNKGERDRYKYTTYKRILEKCYLKIKTCSDNNQSYCIYTIPDFIIGEPLFRKNFCATFIIDHLKDNGFSASFIYPTYVFASWNFGNDNKFEGFRRTNSRTPNIKITNSIKQPKMINFNGLSEPKTKKSHGINNKSNEDAEKFRIINDYVPLKSMLFKKKP
jgi:hypothetical protein|tara:strand:+ start:64 stop:585 length:522 start_codon:yes stop_codon:yes gene_type:complete